MTISIPSFFTRIKGYLRALVPHSALKLDGTAFRAAYRFALPLMVLYELVSFSSWLLPTASSPIFLIIIGLTAVLAMVRFDLAMLVLLAELFVGSQGGYMIAFGAEWGLQLSVRHALFLLLVAIWFAELLAASFAGGERRRAAWAWLQKLTSARIFLPFALLMLAIAFGIARGVAFGHPYDLVFFDVDRSLYFALFPALVTAFAAPKMIERAAALLCSAVSVAVFKALVVLFFFSHRVFDVAKMLYLWIRDTRVGEITVMVADFYRIFFQSQIFILVSMFLAALFVAYSRSMKDRGAKLAAAFVTWAMVSMLLSLSRSFWFGGAVATCALFVLLVWGRAGVTAWKRLVLLGLGSVLVAVGVIALTYSFPYPNKNGGISLASIFSDRAFSFDDDAAKSRWALLPKLTEAAMLHPVFGSGYGATVTYETHDPRLKAANSSSRYTTYAFEWGYHDIWLKIGAFGFGMYVWFLFSLLRPLFLRIRASRAAFRHSDMVFDGGDKQQSIVAAGLFVGLVALLGTNVFSPYLNHPLGIGILLLAGALVANGAFVARSEA